MDNTPTLDNSHKRSFFKTLKIFIIVLIVFIALLGLNAIKQFGYIGRGIVASNTITVQGTGMIMATPDIADFNFSITQNGTTATDAQNAVSTKSAAILAAIKSAGVADADVQTSSYNLSPEYQTQQIACPQVISASGIMLPCQNTSQKIIGYTVSESVSVKVRKIDSAPGLISQVTSLGASDISGITFMVDNQDALQDQARAKAITDAQTKAKTLASELGVSLGKVTSFNDNSGGGIVYPMNAMAVSSGSAAPAPSLPAGQNTITSNVTVTYEIY